MNKKNTALLAGAAAVLLTVVIYVLVGKQQESPSPQVSSATQKPVQYLPVKLNALPDLVLVSQGTSTHYQFTVPPEARKAQFEGEYRITPYPLARMDVALLAESAFMSSADPSGGVLYRNSSRSADKFIVPVQPGTYYLVIKNDAPVDSLNSYGPMDAKRGIDGQIYLTYERPQ